MFQLQRRVLMFLIGALIAASADAQVTWTAITSPTVHNLWGVCFGENLFVTVGEAGTILTSPDGTTWTARTSGTTEWLVGVTYGNKHFVAVGEHGTILTSPDAIIWAPQSIGGGRLNNVAYGEGRFIAVGQDGIVATSLDSVHWNTCRVPVDGWLRGITYHRGQFIIGGQDGTLFSTEDGSRFYYITSFGRAVEALATNDWFLGVNGDHLAQLGHGSTFGLSAVGTGKEVETSYYRGIACYGQTIVNVGERGTIAVVRKSVIALPAYTVVEFSQPSQENLNAVAASYLAVIAVGNRGVILRTNDSASAPTIGYGVGYDVSPLSGRPLSLSLSEPAGGPPTTHRWTFNGAPLAAKNSASLRLESVTSAELGTYTLTSANPLGSITRTFRLTGLTAPLSEAIDPEFHSQLAGADALNVTQLADKRLLALLNDGTAPSLQRFNLDGSWDLSFNADAICADFAVMPDGSTIVYGTRFDTRIGETGCWLLDPAGKLRRIISTETYPRKVIPITNGRFLLVAARVGGIIITRYNADGSLDSEYPAAWVPTVMNEICATAIDDELRIYVAASARLSSPAATLFRLTPDGVLDGTFAAHTIADSIEQMWWRKGRICYDTGLRPSDSRYLPARPRSFGKLMASGEPDPDFRHYTPDDSFESSSTVGVFDLDGGVLIGGPTRLEITRLDRFGIRDEGFRLKTNVGCNRLNLLRDGTLLVSGTFQSVNGVPTANLARIRIASHDHSTHLANLSIRTTAGSGEHTLIAGFIVKGSGARSVLVRGVGPGLIPLGLAANDVIADPQLTLFNGQTVIASNDNWNSAVEPIANRLGAYPLSAGSKDAALFSTLAPGLYTAHATSTTGTAGIALMELYDADPAPLAATDARVVNLAGRAFVGTGDNVLIAGFVLSGSSVKRLLIRAVGPGLRAQGVTDVLNDPELIIHRGSVVIAANDDWSAANRPVFDTVGAFSLGDGSKDSALVLDLAPGVYTALVRGVGNTTGTALIEIYEVP